jgi:RNA polymerase sigma factor (TIGR02999 family)
LDERDHITRMLQAVAAGDASAVDRLYEQVYGELRAVASRHLRGERRDLTLQATDLVHEAYLKLVDQTRTPWQDRAHFLAVASLAMRRILVDHARGKGRQKRGGGWERTTLAQVMTLGAESAQDALIDLDASLDRLAAAEPERARLAQLILFGGLTHDECAQVLGISVRTVSRWWEFSQVWLYRDLAAGGEPAGP